MCTAEVIQSSGPRRNQGPRRGFGWGDIEDFIDETGSDIEDFVDTNFNLPKGPKPGSPPEIPDVPSRDSSDFSALVRRLGKQVGRGEGRRATILTGGRGVTAPFPGTRRTLLG